MAKIGQTIEFQDGSVGTITGFIPGDFVGEPRIVTVQYVQGGKVKHAYISEDKLK